LSRRVFRLLNSSTRVLDDSTRLGCPFPPRLDSTLRAASAFDLLSSYIDLALFTMRVTGRYFLFAFAAEDTPSMLPCSCTILQLGPRHRRTRAEEEERRKSERSITFSSSFAFSVSLPCAQNPQKLDREGDARVAKKGRYGALSGRMSICPTLRSFCDWLPLLALIQRSFTPPMSASEPLR
jgi:hypothetical protein